jgi:hypothetical protein
VHRRPTAHHNLCVREFPGPCERDPPILVPVETLERKAPHARQKPKFVSLKGSTLLIHQHDVARCVLFADDQG